MFGTKRGDFAFLAGTGRRFQKNWALWSVVALLACMALNLFGALNRKSLTTDEITHIPAGYYHLVVAEYTLNNEHPPLAKMWAALPLLFLQPNEPPMAKLDDVDFYMRTHSTYGSFWVANADLFEKISFWCRVPMVLLTLGLGWMIFVFAKQLAGARAGVLAVALFTFEPTVLGHGRIVHTDLPAALAYLLFTFALYYYDRFPSMRRALVVGLAVGVALITKFSLVIVGPLFLLGVLVLLWRGPARGLTRGQIVRHALLAGLIALVIINAAYRFQRQDLLAGDVAWVASKSPEYASAIMKAISVLSIFFPTYFLFGLYNLALHNHYGHSAYLLGEYSDHGWWYYFPVTFALKTTLAFLALTIAALGWGSWRFVVRRDRRLLFLLIPIVAYTALSLTSGVNIGIRHFLLVYPFLFILAAIFLDWLLALSKWKSVTRIVTALLLLAMATEMVRAYPDYFPYMNQLRGNKPGWQLLSDSNVEWGDDVKAVAEYLRARGETQLRGATAAGWLTFRFFGIEYFDIGPSHSPQVQTNYVAIGTGFLNGSTVQGSPEVTGKARENYFAAYRDRKPEAVFGNSIYLYRTK